MTEACPSSAEHKVKHEVGSLDLITILFDAFKSLSNTVLSFIKIYSREDLELKLKIYSKGSKND